MEQMTVRWPALEKWGTEGVSESAVVGRGNPLALRAVGSDSLEACCWD